MLPAKGTLKFKNASSKQELHFLELQQVVEGTTVDQVLESFQSESQGPPEWVLPGHLFTDVISQGRSMTVNYDLPPGQYVALCFMPDPKMGMPHSFMGMIKMIHVMRGTTRHDCVAGRAPSRLAAQPLVLHGQPLGPTRVGSLSPTRGGTTGSPAAAPRCRRTPGWPGPVARDRRAPRPSCRCPSRRRRRSPY